MFAEITHSSRSFRLEYELLSPERADAPLLVFLHEGLGSVAQWRDFPQALCDAAGVRGLVWSRYGYGRSTPRPHDERWQPDYLQVQATEALPALLAALGLQHQRPFLFGHSDGGSIALLYAARFPQATNGIVVLAPHIFVEDVTVAGVAAARDVYLQTSLKQKLARFHDDPDSAFWAWNDAWMTPAFRHWNIEAELPQIACPVLAIQGHGDEYATMAQLDGIQRHVLQAKLLKLDDCGHSPHRDRADAVIGATLEFLSGVC